jgi:hypothetical protein
VRLWAICAVSVLVLAGCGGGTEMECLYHGIRCENLPKHKLFRVNWNEKVDLEANQPIATFRVQSIEVRPRGYTIEASFTNTSPQTFTFPTGGARAPKDFGLGVFTDALGVRADEPPNYLLQAKRITPAMPRELAPGQTWRGTMTSDEPPRPKRWLRVVFGVFFWKGKPPYGQGPFFIYATSHNVQVPGPMGKPAS